MNSKELLNLIKIWLATCRDNQEGIVVEGEAIKKDATWNRGYLACLEDLAGIIKQNS